LGLAKAYLALGDSDQVGPQLLKAESLLGDFEDNIGSLSEVSSLWKAIGQLDHAEKINLKVAILTAKRTERMAQINKLAAQENERLAQIAQREAQAREQQYLAEQRQRMALSGQFPNSSGNLTAAGTTTTPLTGGMLPVGFRAAGSTGSTTSGFGMPRYYNQYVSYNVIEAAEIRIKAQIAARDWSGVSATANGIIPESVKISPEDKEKLTVEFLALAEQLINLGQFDAAKSVTFVVTMECFDVHNGIPVAFRFLSLAQTAAAKGNVGCAREFVSNAQRFLITVKSDDTRKNELLERCKVLKAKLGGQ